MHPTRVEVRAVLRQVLAADFAGQPDDFLRGQLTVTIAEPRPGRRRFPFRSDRIGIATMGSGVVATTSTDRVDWLRAILSGRGDEVFSAPTIAELQAFARSHRERVAGPHLAYATSAVESRFSSLPSGVDVALVEGAAIEPLRAHDAFRNALPPRDRPERSDVLAVVATEDDQIIGMAGASADADAAWQIGVDVIPEARGRGVGRAVVARLADAILARGAVPYYSTTLGNLASRTLAVSVGFWPAWVELFTAAEKPPSEADSTETLIPTLTDGTIVLNGYVLADAEAQASGEDEEFARRFGWYPNHSTPDGVRQHILHLTREWQIGGPTRGLAARDAVTGALVGGCELRLQGEGLAHISWWTLATHRRRGYAARAARLACGYAFAHLAAERVEAYIEVDNFGSRGVARAAGFREEGILRRQGHIGGERRDMVLYALLLEDQG